MSQENLINLNQFSMVGHTITRFDFTNTYARFSMSDPDLKKEFNVDGGLIDVRGDTSEWQGDIALDIHIKLSSNDAELKADMKIIGHAAASHMSKDDFISMALSKGCDETFSTAKAAIIAFAAMAVPGERLTLPTVNFDDRHFKDR